MRIPLSVRIKSIFARDKHALLWNEVTNEEKKLRRMDVWQLAKVINDARARNIVGMEEKRIVAEHMLNERIAKIQSTASWRAALAGAIVAIVCVFIGDYLNSKETKPGSAQSCSENMTTQRSQKDQTNVSAPTQEPMTSVGGVTRHGR